MRQSIIGRYGYKPWRETIISLCVMVGVVNELHTSYEHYFIIFVLSLHTGSSPVQYKAVQYTLHSTLLATQNHFDTKA